MFETWESLLPQIQLYDVHKTLHTEHGAEVGLLLEESFFISNDRDYSYDSTSHMVLLDISIIDRSIPNLNVVISLPEAFVSFFFLFPSSHQTSIKLKFITIWIIHSKNSPNNVRRTAGEPHQKKGLNRPLSGGNLFGPYFKIAKSCLPLSYSQFYSIWLRIYVAGLLHTVHGSLMECKSQICRVNFVFII